MAFCRPMRTALVFEELEPRLLFSADLAMGETEVAEQDYTEEPVITADLESSAEAEDTALQAEGDEGAAAEPEEEAQAADDVAEDTVEPEAAGAGSPEPAEAGETADDSGEKEKEKDPPITAADDAGNSPPVVTAPDTTVDYAPGDPPVILAPEATVADADSDEFFQGTLTVSIPEGGGDDELAVVEGGEVSLLNNHIKVEQKLVGSFAGGTGGEALVISWTPQATPDCVQAVLRQIAYGNGSDSATIEDLTVDFVLTDGDGGTDTLQVTINDTGSGGDTGPGDGGQEDGGGEGEAPPENVAPVLTQSGGPFDYLGGSQALLLAPTATVVDIDSADFKQGTLTVSFSQGGSPGDQLLIAEGGDVTLLNNNIKVEQKLVGSFAGGTDGAALIISWSPQATPAYAEAVLRQIAYGNGSADPAPGGRTVDFVLTDGDGGTSNTVQAFVNVAAGSGSPGEDPGQGGGEDGEQDAGGEVTPPDNDPIEEPIDNSDEKLPVEPEPVSGGSNEKATGGSEQQPAGAEFETVPPSVAPASQPAALQPADYEAGGGNPTDFLTAVGNLPDETIPHGAVREAHDPVHEDPAGRNTGRTLSAADGRVQPDDATQGPGAVMATDMAAEPDVAGGQEQSASIAVHGQNTGDVPPGGKFGEAIRTTIGRLFAFFTPPSATAAPVPSLNQDPAGDGHANHEMVCREVEIMRQEMEEAFLESHRADRLMVYTTTGASLSLTAGIASYLFRSGSLMSGFLATVPLWKRFDPVCILSTPKTYRKDAGRSPVTVRETADQKAETMFAAGGKA